MEEGERITAVLPVRDFPEDQYVFMATGSGTVKKTPLSHFSRPRASGIIAVELRSDDYLIGVAITDGKRDVMLFSDAGKAIRFKEDSVRPMGRTACGVRGIKLGPGKQVIGLIIVNEGDVLTATERGYGKRTAIADFPVHGRGGQGVIAMQVGERNGPVVRAVQVEPSDEIMLITNVGTLVRTRVDEISMMGRNAQGVRLISIGEHDKLVGVERIASLNGEVEGEEPDTDAESP